MNNGKDRILGRILAVEETRHVSGAKTPASIGTDPIGTAPEGGVETSCVADSTDSTCDISVPVNESTVFDDSGTVADTGPALDCSTSTTKLDINIGDPLC